MVFNPNNPVKLFWDLFIGIFILYSVIIIPYRVGFNITPNQNEEAFDLFITSLFAFDMLITFNTAYLDIQLEVLVFRRWKIAKQYLTFWFWIDLLAMFPFDGIANAAVANSNLGAIRIIRIFRLVRLFKLYQLCQRNQTLRKLQIHPEIIYLCTLILQIFFVAHVLACFWHYIALPDVASGMKNTWLKQFGFEGGDLGTRYIAALYYTFVTMLTVGYGDIRATNQIEYLYAIMVMLVGGLVFGALVQKLASIIDRFNPKSKGHSEQMYELKVFLTDMQIPPKLRDETKVWIF